MFQTIIRRLALPAVLLLATLPAAGGRAKEADLKAWPQGPVRYIARPEELKTFKALANDDERALFIERFWARRDPLPETVTNEYRQIFWERVQQANAQFLDAPKPGWMTDRGKILILYGPPTEIKEEHDLQTRGRPDAGRGLIRWIYEGRPGGRADLNPIVVVPFVPDSGGEYRVSYDPKLSSVFFDALAIREGRDRLDRFAEMLGAPVRSYLSVMLDLGRLQEVPPQEQVLLERVETVESYKTLPIQAQVSRYDQRDKQGALAVVTADLRNVTHAVKPAIVARFSPHDKSRQTVLLGEDSFRIEEHAGQRLAQGRVVLAPGRYELTLLVADPQTAATGLHRQSLVVAEPSTDVHLSDLVWARELEPLPFASLTSYDEPYLIGPFRVVPKLDGTYRIGEPIQLFFEVYGGEPPYRIEYRIEGREQDGRWVSLGKPSQTESSATAQAWGIPTTPKWPLGEYRVRIEIEDRLEKTLTTLAPFILEAAGPA